MTRQKPFHAQHIRDVSPRALSAITGTPADVIHAHLQAYFDARGASWCGCGLAKGHGPCEFAPMADTRRAPPPTGNREAESLALIASTLSPEHLTPTLFPPPAEHTPATVAVPPCAPDVDG